MADDAIPCLRATALSHPQNHHNTQQCKNGNSLCAEQYWAWPFPGYSLSTSSKRPCVRRFSVLLYGHSYGRLCCASDCVYSGPLHILFYIFAGSFRQKTASIQKRYRIESAAEPGTRDSACFAWSMTGLAKKTEQPKQAYYEKLLELAGVPTNHGIWSST